MEHNLFMIIEKQLYGILKQHLYEEAGRVLRRVVKQQLHKIS